MMHVLEQFFHIINISQAMRTEIADDLLVMIDEVRGFWTADWTDWREMCKFVAGRLEHYAARFRQHAEVE